MLNATAKNPTPILENIAHNLNTSSKRVNVTWPYSVPNDTATDQLYFIATASGGDIANPGAFNLTLPAGESRGQAEGTVGPYGTHPSTDSAPSSTPSPAGGLSGGAIAGIVVGSVVLVGLCLLGILLYFRRKRQQRRLLHNDVAHEKPELDAITTSGHKRNKTMGTFTSTELDGSDRSDRKERLGSGELEGDTKDYLRYELPSTPPPPAELPNNEIPAAEMPSPDLNDEVHTVPHIGDWPLPDVSTPTPRRPESVLSGTDARSIGSSMTAAVRREMSFAEALHEIVSQELRRKE